jgi:DNA-binding NarL/FixJ family response regulator
MLTSIVNSKYVIKALENNADGYASKGMDFIQLVSMIQSVYEGKFCNDEKINDEVLNCREYIKQKSRILKDFALLTPREYEIVELISKGKSRTELKLLLRI